MARCSISLMNRGTRYLAYRHPLHVAERVQLPTAWNSTKGVSRYWRYMALHQGDGPVVRSPCGR